MHFFYIDESGDTGKNLDDVDQPIMLIGGVSLSDEKWNNTQQAFQTIISNYFNNVIPIEFELHSTDLLSPNGDGTFAGHDRLRRNQLAFEVLNILCEQSHNVHLVAFSKQAIKNTKCGLVLAFNPSRPYLLGFDYLITYINNHIKEKLGTTARGLIILDEKENHHGDIEKIMYDRRFLTQKGNRVKRIVEFSYPVDSQKNPMIQISDLVLYCTKRFLEFEHGLRNAPQPAKEFYAKCYDIINSRIAYKSIVPRGEKKLSRLNEYIEQVRLTHPKNWKKNYNL